MTYNLIATTEKITANQACSELWIALRAIGDEEPKVGKTRVRGVIKAYTNLDPLEAVYGLRDLMKENPEKFSVIFRILPLEKLVPTDIEDIVNTVEGLITRIQHDETFRVTLEKRRVQLRSLEIIESVAFVIDREVDLENPDWVVLIEIMGKETGVSVIPPQGILNIQKEKYQLSLQRK